MPVAALEINDTGLVLAVGGSTPGLSAPSPGFALIDGHELTVGREAWHRARLHPRHVDHRFWNGLETAPLGRPFPAGMSRADLAHAHLLEIWRPGRTPAERAVAASDEPECILVVPGWYSVEQLGLLLGIARAGEIPVTGMIDSAVAAVAGDTQRAPRLVHLDLSLHRSTVTSLDDDAECRRLDVASADKLGLVALHAAWARALAETFVRRTRFDPLLEGESEQQLHDRLQGWLEQAASHDEVAVTMSSGGADYTIELTHDEWLAPVSDHYEQICAQVRSADESNRADLLLASSRIASLPGLRQRLVDDTDLDVVDLEEGAAASGALLYESQIREPGETLPFVTRLLRASTGAPGTPLTGVAPTAATDRSRTPTHVVYRGTAYPLGSAPFAIGTDEPPSGDGLRVHGESSGISRRHCRIVAGVDGPEVEDLSRYGTRVNGERIQGSQPLAIGDVLGFGSPETEVSLIDVARSPAGRTVEE